MIYDINLISKSKKKASTNIIFVISLLSLFIITLLLFYGLYLPIQQKNKLINKMEEQKEQLLYLTEEEKNYIELKSKIDEISRFDEMLSLIKSSNLKITEIIKSMEENIPSDIMVNSLVLSADMLTIEGKASSYQDIAEYIIKLRKIERVVDVNFINSLKEDNKEDTNTVKIQPYKFTIYVRLNVSDILSDYLALQDKAASGTGEGVSIDETN